MSFFTLNKFLIISLLLLAFKTVGQYNAHVFIDSLPNTTGRFSTFNCNRGLTYKIWNQTGLSSCNAFFGGSPGTAPTGFSDSGTCSNTQYKDFVVSPAWDEVDDIVELNGFILIAEAGNYRFRTISDEGSRLYVNNTLVVSNDGLHGAITVTSAVITLATGVYPYKCQYFEGGGNHTLNVSWETPSITGFNIIPDKVFFRDNNSTCTNFWMNPNKPLTLYSCPKQLQDLNAPSGIYFFDPDGDGLNPIEGYYDNSLGGGWLMVLNYVHLGGTNPVLNVRSGDLPLLQSSSLGVDESGTEYWGHASNSLLNQFTISEVRFRGITSAHTRVLDFSTTNANVINYIQTGTGSMTGIQTGFTKYTGLGGNVTFLPNSVVNFFVNQGDLALTNFPFWLAANYHWGIRGLGNRWEVDDFPATFSQSTIHRVWIRTTDCSSVNSSFYSNGDNVNVAESITKGNTESNFKQPTAANQPLYRDNTTDNINFNPVFEFTNTDILSSSSVIGAENSELTFFIVGKEKVRTNNTVVKFKNSGTGTDRYFIHFPWGDGFVYWDAGTSSAPERILGAMPNPVGQSTIAALTNSLTSNTQRIKIDGVSVANDITGHLVTGLDSTILGDSYNGFIGDLIVIDKLLSPVEIERIESYLAIKYGVTLGHNYYSSQDKLVYDISSGYANDIFGVGRDEIHCLYQKKSHTEIINTSDVIFELTQDISDHQFLISGHNGAVLTRRSFAGETNVLTREWFANMNGNIGTINVEVDLASIGANTSPALFDVKIIIANNPSFNNPYSITASSISGGVAKFEGIPLYDKYFTFSAAP